MGKMILHSIRQCLWFWVLLIASLTFLTASFLVPPMGTIDSSVLKAISELLGFGVLGTVIYAVDKGVDLKLSKGDLAATINSPDNDTT